MVKEFFEEIKPRLIEVATEWDRAEALVKQAELLRSEVVQASINELRYGGRKLIDALQILSEDSIDDVEIEKAYASINACLNNCYCAQHDAIDALNLFVKRALKAYEVEFGIKLLAEKFPDYYSIKALLDEGDDLIVDSRGNRTERQIKYKKFGDKIYSELLVYYRKLKSGREIFQALIVAQREQKEIDDKKHNQQIWWPISVAILLAVLGATNFQNINNFIKKLDSPAAASEKTSKLRHD